MKKLRLPLPALLALTMAAGCSGETLSAANDVGLPPDSGAVDAGERPEDAGLADAGDLDAGAPDAGAPSRLPIELLGAAAVQDLLSTRGAQIVDVRSASAFAAGHAPGAVHLPTAGLRGTVGGVPSQVVSRAGAEAIFEAAGVDTSRDLVVVGPSNDTGTARALWTLALYGAGQVSLLDGGHPSWVASNGTLETEATASPTTWTDAPTKEGLRTNKAWLLEHYQDADVRIFDVRTAGEYAAGHIPGAVNKDWTQNLGAGGLFDDLETIRDFHGDPTEPTLVVYCQSGARASVTWTLLKAAGYEDVRLYDGSWNEWGSDPDTPKETGN